MNSSIDIDKNNHFLGYYYGVGEVLSLDFTPQPGMFFVNGETNSLWVWDALARMWIDTNRVDSGMKGMLTDVEGNSPADYKPSPQSGVKECYFYVAECDDVDANPNAKSKTITFSYFKNGASSVSATVRKTSIITLFWNGDYWETSVVPFINANYSVYATKTELNVEEQRAIATEQKNKADISSIYNKLFDGVDLQTDDVRTEYYLDGSGTIKESFSKTTDVSVFYNVENYRILLLSLKSGNKATAVYKFFSDTELTSVINDSNINTPISITDDAGISLNNHLLNIPSGARAIAICYNREEGLALFAGNGRFAEKDDAKILQANLDSLTKEIEGGEFISADSLIINKNKISPTDGSASGSDAFGHYEIALEAGKYKSLRAKMLKFNTAGYAFYDKDGVCIASAIANVQNNGDWQNIEIPEDATLFKNTICKKDVSEQWIGYYFPIDKVILDDGSFDSSIKGQLENINGKLENVDAMVETAEVVYVPRGGFVFADGASFMQNYKDINWLATAMRKLGLEYENIAVGGQSIKDTAYRLCNGDEYSLDELERMDLFLIQHVHNYDVFSLTKERSIEEYEAVINENKNNLTYAEAYDYVIKKHLDNCYNLQFVESSKWYNVKGGKPSQILLCTHWHDGRKVFNSSVRKLCAKWGIALCKMDTNIGFSKNATHPVATFNGEAAQMSVFYSQKSNGAGYLGSLEESETEVINGEYFGFHPYFGKENYNYLADKMASILIRCICVDNQVKWSESFNINNYKTQGIYYITGERLLSEYDNLPIANASSGHTISGQLTVLDASLSDAEQCITQYLKLTNRTGSEGKEYVRTYNKYSDGSEGWSDWREIKQTANLNQISDAELKNYTENGLYEGAIFNGNYDIQDINTTITSFISAIATSDGAKELPSGSFFTMEVLNNYAIVAKAEQMGLPTQQSIVQRAKVLLIRDSYYEVYRKYFNVDDNGPRSYWSKWFIVGKL